MLYYSLTERLVMYRIPFFISIFTIVLWPWSGPGLAAPELVQVRPDHDNFTRDGLGVQNHFTNLSFGASDISYMRFDITGVPDGVVIQSAVLTMRSRNDFAPDTAVNIHSLTNDGWLETTIENSNEPAVGPVIATYDNHAFTGKITPPHPSPNSQSNPPTICVPA